MRDNYLAGVNTQIAELQAKHDQIAYKDSAVLLKMVVNKRYGHADGFDPKRDTDVKFGKDKAPDNPGLNAHGLRLKLTGLAAQRAVAEGLVDRGKLARIAQ